MTKKERHAQLQARLQVGIARVFNTCDEHGMAAARELMQYVVEDSDKAARWDWAELIFNGDGSPLADARSMILGVGLIRGKTAAEAIDEALDKEVDDGP